MRALVGYPDRFEFSIAGRDNCVLVENHAGYVVIHAARENFSSREKSFLVRHLAAEGFIPERYERFDGSEPENSCGVTWLFDAFLADQDSARRRKALRQILRLIFWATLGWAGTIIFAVLHYGH
jgi:hypothetical protein